MHSSVLNIIRRAAEAAVKAIPSRLRISPGSAATSSLVAGAATDLLRVNPDVSPENVVRVQEPARTGSPENPVASLSRYELSHLTEHLKKAGRYGDLHKLLLLSFAARDVDEAEYRSINAWYAAKHAEQDIEGYLQDITTAIDLVSGENVLANFPVAFPLIYRYALMHAS